MGWRRRIADTLRRAAGTDRVTMAQAFGAATQAQQVALHLEYRSLRERRGSLPCLEDVGFRVYSQMEEDGLLLYLFSVIGMGGRRCIELAFGSPIGANTTNLICNWGWEALLIEGDPRIAASAVSWFQTHPDTWIHPPTVVCRWVDSKSLDVICRDYEFTGEIDLLSLDMDGIDFWVWKHLELVRPRVVVVEVQNIWGPEDSFTVPDDARFASARAVDFGFFGASLAAFVKLGRNKGYRLVGANRQGINAFFVRNDIGTKDLPEVSVVSCVDRPHAAAVRKEYAGRLQKQDWVAV